MRVQSSARQPGVERRRQGRVARHDVGAEARGRLVLVGVDALRRAGDVGPQNADEVVRLPHLERAAGPQQAQVLLDEAVVLLRLDGQAHVLDHDQVELAAGQRPRHAVEVVVDKGPAHVAVGPRGVGAGPQRGQVDAGEGDAAVAAVLVAVAHDAPEARAAADLEHAPRLPLGQRRRAHGHAEELDQQQRAQRLAVELRQVAREGVRQRLVAEVRPAVAHQRPVVGRGGAGREQRRGAAGQQHRLGAGGGGFISTASAGGFAQDARLGPGGGFCPAAGVAVAVAAGRSAGDDVSDERQPLEVLGRGRAAPEDESLEVELDRRVYGRWTGMGIMTDEFIKAA